jgi:hypothetical protein
MGLAEEFVKAKSAQAELEEMITEFLQLRLAEPLQGGYDPPRCKTCVWFCPQYPDFKIEFNVLTRSEEVHVLPQPLGHCRKHAPEVMASTGARAFPLVNETDWCGDHQPGGAPA